VVVPEVAPSVSELTLALTGSVTVYSPGVVMQTLSLDVGTLPVDQSASVVHEPLTGAAHESVQPAASASAGVKAASVKRALTLTTTIAMRRAALEMTRCR
jgi:hypothetical protein